MKKRGSIWLLCLVTMCLVSCGTQKAEEQDEVQVHKMGILDQGVFLSVGMEKEDTVEQLEEEPEYFEAPSCAYEGTEYIYTYNNYTITCYEEEKEKISSIIITSDLIITTEGVTIGDTMEKVRTIYGEPKEETEKLFVYEENGTLLRIIFENQNVISVEFQKIW